MKRESHHGKREKDDLPPGFGSFLNRRSAPSPIAHTFANAHARHLQPSGQRPLCHHGREPRDGVLSRRRALVACRTTFHTDSFMPGVKTPSVKGVLEKSHLLLVWFRSTIPGLVEIRHDGARHQVEILGQRVVSASFQIAAKNLRAIQAVLLQLIDEPEDARAECVDRASGWVHG